VINYKECGGKMWLKLYFKTRWFYSKWYDI